MSNFLDFEGGVAEIEGKIVDLQRAAGDSVDIQDEISRLSEKVKKQLNNLYDNLTPWQKTQVARHQDRPHFLNYAESLFEDFTPLAGDRAFGEDKAIIGGPARFRGRPVMLMGHEKGGDLETRMLHNFGMARPEGYRKAIRLMEMAERFQMPVVTLVDTSGAYPGLGAEQRGQAEAIARSIEACLDISVPLVSVIIGEGGSGGAIALATGNRVLMLEHSIYSVISPEGCASILWRSADKAQDAAEALKLTAQDLIGLGIIDEIIGEPLGGAQRAQKQAILSVGDSIDKHLKELEKLDGDALKKDRRDKFLAMGRLEESA